MAVCGGTDVLGPEQEIRLAPDGTGVAIFEGTRFRFLGFQDQRLRYRVERVAGPQLVLLQHREAARTLTIALP